MDFRNDLMTIIYSFFSIFVIYLLNENFLNLQIL
jgi:hypothetical protein